MHNRGRTRVGGKLFSLAVGILMLGSAILAFGLLAPVARAQTVVATVSVRTGPRGAVYDSGKGEVFVTNYSSNTVSVISYKAGPFDPAGYILAGVFVAVALVLGKMYRRKKVPTSESRSG